MNSMTSQRTGTSRSSNAEHPKMTGRSGSPSAARASTGRAPNTVQQRKRSPTAAERILSLFTGKTDLEDPNARDGSPGVEKPREHRRKPLKWNGGLTTWWTGKGDLHDYGIELRAGRYRASGPKLPPTDFPSLIEATEACERAAGVRS